MSQLMIEVDLHRLVLTHLVLSWGCPSGTLVQRFTQRHYKAASLPSGSACYYSCGAGPWQGASLSAASMHFGD